MSKNKSNARDRAEAGEIVDARFHNAVHDADDGAALVGLAPSRTDRTECAAV